MAFLPNSRKPSTPAQSARQEPGPRLPDIDGQRAPSGITAPVVMPPVCKNCGKNPNIAPSGASADSIKMMLKELGDADGLSPWEDEFVSDIEEKYERFGRLSDKQVAKLQAIHEEKVANPRPSGYGFK